MDADDERHSGFFSGFASNEDDHYGKQPRRKRKRGISAGTIALVVVIVVLAGIGGVGYHFYSVYKSRHASYTGSGYGSVVVTVDPGANALSIAPELQRLGVIESIDPFVKAADESSNPTGLQQGRFKLHEHMGPSQAWALLLDPKSRVKSQVTVPDGLRYSKILPILATQSGIPLSQFESAIKDTAALGLPSYAHGNPEGYLYPATYDTVPGDTALKILQTAVAQFKTEMANLNLAAKAKVAQFTESQVITEASLLEAEVPPTYYAKVARVIDNRLTAVPQMYLGLDSTIAYATNTYVYNLTQSDLNVKSPYNTRLHLGLPPGPIDSPDLTAIEAVLHPAQGNWTYFCTVNKHGLTLFTNSASQFQVWSNEAKQNGV
jgi:UPF0755 protein